MRHTSRSIADLLAGWTSPPTDCADANDPCPTQQPAFDPDKANASIG